MHSVPQVYDIEDDDTEYVDDPAELSSMGDEKSFAEQVEALVAAETPRLFALVGEVEERKDAMIMVWGIAFAEHAEVVSAAHDGVRGVFNSAERACELLSAKGKVKVRLVWVDQTQEQVIVD
jgi:hypothetical protein